MTVSPQRKIVFTAFGADTYGEDIALFEHMLLFALETAVESTGHVSYADVHDKVGGNEKRERPTPPFTPTEIQGLMQRAGCDALVDGMLQCTRNPETGGLSEVTVALRVSTRDGAEAVTPDALTFRAFQQDTTPDTLRTDFDLLIALQFRLCEQLLSALGEPVPGGFTTDSLQITQNAEAYELFIKAKRTTVIPENKLGYYEAAIKRDAGFFWALYNAAMLYKTQTDYERLRKRMLQAARATNDPALLGDVYFEIGLASIYLGDPKTARNFWEQALGYAGDNPSLLVNMAGTYEQEEKWQDALQLNEQALAIDPNYHKAIVNLGRLHAMFGRLDEAIPLYERALELQPDDALRHSVLGGCLLAAGRTEEARAHFERAVELDPEGDPGRYAQQELTKMGPTDEPRRKRWGLF